MKSKKFLTFAALSLLLLSAVGVSRADDGMLTAYVVHGIDGDDFGLDPMLPVDVEVSGLGCAIPYFEFGDRVGPLQIPAGSYDITISLADRDNPCDGTDVIALEGVMLPAGANATIIAHRTADGSPGAGDLLELGVTASLFGNDFTSTGRGKSRVLVHHTALAPTVDVVVSRNYASSGAPAVRVPGFTNPTADSEVGLSQINAEFRPGSWDVALEVDGATVFGPDSLRLAPFAATYIYAVGDFFGGTFQYLIYTEGGLKAARGKSSKALSRGRQIPGR